VIEEPWADRDSGRLIGMDAGKPEDGDLSVRGRALLLVAIIWLALTGWPASTGTASASARVNPAAALFSAVITPESRVAYRSPVTPMSVLRGFTPGVTQFAAGHRGVDLAVSPQVTVAAAADGVVSFAGAVAGRAIVVVAHPDGIRTTYEPVRPLVAAGQSVRAGQPIGIQTGTHPGCPQTCLHWGARRGEVYIDPLLLLRPLGPIRLLPWV
jgi:murein DD-endopeptidase MepM/ murein hydrolase activator NlpD